MSGVNEVSLMLQTAVIQKLLNDATLTGLVVGRVYDDVPPKSAMPYLVWKADQINDDGADCVFGSEIFFSLHVWSKIFGSLEAKRIAGLVREILSEVDLTITDHRLVTLIHQVTRWIDDPDGITKHGIVTFRALVDEVEVV